MAKAGGKSKAKSSARKDLLKTPPKGSDPGSRPFRSLRPAEGRRPAGHLKIDYFETTTITPSRAFSPNCFTATSPEKILYDFIFDASRLSKACLDISLPSSRIKPL